MKALILAVLLLVAGCAAAKHPPMVCQVVGPGLMYCMDAAELEAKK